jgi:hypothetical protein
MKCPICTQELVLVEPAEAHMERYGQVIQAKTVCCGNIVQCTPYLSYDVEQSDDDSDSWGNDKG